MMLPLLAAVAMPAMAQTAPAAAVPAAAGAPVSFEVYLPLRDTAGLKALLAAQQDEASPSYHKWLTPAQFSARFGPTADTVAAAKAALAAAGLNVTKVNSRSLRVSGSVSNTNALLGTSLGTVRDLNGKTRTVAMAKPVMAPALQALGARVLAFSGVQPHHPMATLANAKAIPDNRYGAVGPYWFTDLKQAYDYPAYNSFLGNKQRLDGTGVSAAVLMEDLTYDGDVAAFFNHEKFLENGGDAIPKPNTVLVNGGGTVGGPGTFEASLDVQQVSSGAPGATTTLVSIPDLSDDNITDGYNYIVNTNTFDVVSSSFGGCELFYTADYNNGTDYTYVLQTYEEIFQQGNAQGITFLASSGDNGGLECTDKKYLNGKAGKFIKGVSTPAASGYVTAVGGGNLVTAAASGSLDSTYVSENGIGDPLSPYDPYGTGGTVSGGIWGAGGGRSTIFPASAAQTDYKVKTGSTMRTLPDIGMQVGGCPGTASSCGSADSAAVVAQNGKFYGVIGTSVSSPELAGAVALFIQRSGGRVGDINPYLYKRGLQQTKAGGINAPADQLYYHRNNPSNDGVYTDSTPSINYNYIYGNGSPDVRVLFNFTKFKPAGVPQTATNP